MNGSCANERVCVHVRVRAFDSTSLSLQFEPPQRYMQQMCRHVRMTTSSVRIDTSLKEIEIAFCAARLRVSYGFFLVCEVCLHAEQKPQATQYCYIAKSIKKCHRNVCLFAILIDLV